MLCQNIRLHINPDPLLTKSGALPILTLLLVHNPHSPSGMHNPPHCILKNFSAVFRGQILPDFPAPPAPPDLTGFPCGFQSASRAFDHRFCEIAGAHTGSGSPDVIWIIPSEAFITKPLEREFRLKEPVEQCPGRRTAPAAFHTREHPEGFYSTRRMDKNRYHPAK